MTAQKAGGAAFWWSVSEWEFREAVKRMKSAQKLPHGERGDTYQRIAADYGVSVRSLQRWVHYDVRPIRCGKFEALFVIGNNRPSQVTPWEQVA